MGNATSQVKDVLNNSKLHECCVINAFKSINLAPKDTRLATWGGFGSSKNKGQSVGPDTLQDAKKYLEIGKGLVDSAPWAGVCQTFACASAYLIHKHCPLIMSIELFSFGTKFSGHVFLTLNRPENSTEEDPGTWGRALNVDIWYAIQKQTPTEPVYKGGTYITWLKSNQNIKRVLKVK